MYSSSPYVTDGERLCLLLGWNTCERTLSAITDCSPKFSTRCLRSLTVTMMSRITLHLKRAAHNQEIRESTLRASNNMTTAQWRPGSDMQFARLGPAGYTACTTQAMPYTPFNITVSEKTATHNGYGEEVHMSHRPVQIAIPPTSHAGIGSPVRSKADKEEWYEFTQLRSREEKDLPLVLDSVMDLDTC